jgi:hypothetical protein
MHARSLFSAAALLSAACAAPLQAQTLSGFNFQSFTAPSLANLTSCSGTANTTAQIGPVHFAQTHLLSTSHPFFHLSANRAALLRVTVTGSGASPVVWVQGSANGSYLGRICLSGPSTLPASVDANTPSSSTSFVGTLPASWMKPGLQLQISAGKSISTVTAAQLKIGAAPVLTFVTADWLLFGDTQPTPMPAGFAQEFASKLPLTGVQHSVFPATISVSQLPIAPRGDGYTPTGSAAGNAAAVVATSVSHCSPADKTAGTCTAWSGFGVLAAVRSMTGAIQKANGMDRLSHWYGAESLNRHAGGGLGGGSVGSGDDYDTIFNHELGHAFDMPHWGDSLYTRVASNATQIHPYTGQVLDAPGVPHGGGYGNSWAYDPLNPIYSAFVNPICASLGRERQDPMQRVGSACLGSGRLFDHFGDYSALFVHRYFIGAASVYAGTVSSPRDLLGNTAAPFSFPTKSGRPNLQFGATPKIMKWNATSAAYQEVTAANLSTDTRVFGEYYPLQWNVPVYTLWGSFSSATPGVTTIQTPLQYRGNLKRLWDPTNATDFAAMKAWISGDGFWWGRDLVAKVEFADGTIQHYLVDATARGTTATSGSTFAYWAVNIPAPSANPLKTVSLYYRPMDVRYAGSGTDDYHTAAANLNNPVNAGVTAANYMSGATLVATRSF